MSAFRLVSLLKTLDGASLVVKKVTKQCSYKPEYLNKSFLMSVVPALACLVILCGGLVLEILLFSYRPAGSRELYGL